MREELKSRLAPGGRLVVSGLPLPRRDDAVRYLTQAGYSLYEEKREGDWVALGFRLD
jgi:ribosomal protein L11 methylase PrmA